MKNATIGFLLITLFLFSCQNQDSIITEEVLPVSEAATIITIKGKITERFSSFSPYLVEQQLNNVSVKLMHEGIMLDEVNTDGYGKYAFDEQLVPLDEAYLIFEAPGFYKNVAKLDSFETYNSFNNILLRKTFEGLNGDAISDEGSYIRLITEPANGDFLVPTFLITNANDELIGANQQYVETSFFEITTLANEPLYFHHLTECGMQTIEMGPFSEDTNITPFLEGFILDNKDRETIKVNVFDCTGLALNGTDFKTFYKRGDLTSYGTNSSGTNNNPLTPGKLNCLIDEHPTTLVSIVTQNPRKYAETTIDYTSGQDEVDINICEDDDTYLNYSVNGGTEIEPNLFTYANILPNGNLILKQTDPVYPEGTHIAFQIFDSTQGSTTNGEVLFNNQLEGKIDVIIVGQNINVEINLNDGVFIEGTFSGEVYNALENSLGELSGSFRARLH